MLGSVALALMHYDGGGNLKYPHENLLEANVHGGGMSAYIPNYGLPPLALAEHARGDNEEDDNGRTTGGTASAH